MPSFDITSEVNWHELENAIQQASKEVLHRFDFKGIQSTIELDKKASMITLFCSQREKLSSLNDVFQTKLVKRGISLLLLDYQKEEEASGSGSRQKVLIQNGIPQDKAKKIISVIKGEKIKAQVQIQGTEVRVSSKSRDVLQGAIQFLKSKQDELKVPMNFGNFRD